MRSLLDCIVRLGRSWSTYSHTWISSKEGGHVNIYIHTHVYIYMHNGIIHVYSYGLFSHTRRRQNSPIRKWTNINIFFTDITAFRLSTCPNVCGSHFFVSKQNGEINWTWFYVQRFTVWNILRCLFWWTSHHCSWPKHWTFPPHEIGEWKGWETKLGG